MCTAKTAIFDKVAESWELSTHPAGESSLAGGDHPGLILSQYFQQFPEVLGKNRPGLQGLSGAHQAHRRQGPSFHPRCTPATSTPCGWRGQYGKTEMWVIVDCEPGAFLYFGVNRPVSKEEFQQRIENNTVLEVLNKVEVRPGDVFFIQSGTIHAIGAGILICEIQQNSNCTYRVYDYGRRGADGKPRELHIAKALDVCRLEPSDTASHLGPVRSCAGGTAQTLAECPYFSTEKLRVEEALVLEAGEDSFISLLCVKGGGRLEGPENALEFTAGDSLFVPAGTGRVRVCGEAELVKTTVPAQGE